MNECKHVVLVNVAYPANPATAAGGERTWLCVDCDQMFAGPPPRSKDGGERQFAATPPEEEEPDYLTSDRQRGTAPKAS